MTLNWQATHDAGGPGWHALLSDGYQAHVNPDGSARYRWHICHEFGTDSSGYAADLPTGKAAANRAAEKMNLKPKGAAQ